MVSTRPLTSKSSSPFNNPSVTVPKALITIGTIDTFMFHSFFNSLARSRYLPFFSHSFSFILLSAGTAKSTILQILPFFFFFLLIIIRSGLLGEIRWSVCMSKTHRSLCVSFSRTGAVFVHTPLVGMVKSKFLAHFPVDHLAHPVVSSLVLFLWLMVSSLSPHSLHLLFYWVLSILALVWLVLIALFCDAIRRDSVSL